MITASEIINQAVARAPQAELSTLDKFLAQVEYVLSRSNVKYSINKNDGNVVIDNQIILVKQVESKAINAYFIAAKDSKHTGKYTAFTEFSTPEDICKIIEYMRMYRPDAMDHNEYKGLKDPLCDSITYKGSRVEITTFLNDMPKTIRIYSSMKDDYVRLNYESVKTNRHVELKVKKPKFYIFTPEYASTFKPLKRLIAKLILQYKQEEESDTEKDYKSAKEDIQTRYSRFDTFLKSEA